MGAGCLAVLAVLAEWLALLFDSILRLLFASLLAEAGVAQFFCLSTESMDSDTGSSMASLSWSLFLARLLCYTVYYVKPHFCLSAFLPFCLFALLPFCLSVLCLT